MPVNLAPLPVLRFCDNNGNPLAGGQLYTYQAGTTTPQTSYTDSTGATPNTNPIILNARGECSAWFTAGQSYKLALYDAASNLVWTQDNLLGIDDFSTLTASTGSTLIGYTLGVTGAVARSVSSKLKEWVSIKDFGAVCDGTTNDTAAVSAAISWIGSSSQTLVIPGPTKINTALTFGGSTYLLFQAGASFIGTSGSELIQIQRQIEAPRARIFSNCIPRATNGCYVFPEWFGAKKDNSTDDLAAFQAAVSYLQNVGGPILLESGTYVFSSNLNIAYSGITIQGSGQNATFIALQGTTTTGIQVVGNATGPVTVNNVKIQDLSIKRTTSNLGAGGAGIVLYYTSLAKLRNVSIFDFVTGVSHIYAVNSIEENVIVSFGGNAVNNPRGFDFNGTGTAAGGSKSSVMRCCWVDHSLFTGTGSIGFYCYGQYVSDLVFDNCETAGAQIGFQFDLASTVAAGNEDTQLINCRADMFKTYGIYINGHGPDNDSMISVIGGWLDPTTNGASPVYSVYLNDAQGTLVQGCQFRGTGNPTYTTHIKMASCLRIKLLGNTFTQCKYAIDASGSGYNVVSGNSFMASSGYTATAFINFVGDARTSINGNCFDGYATTGVLVDGTSSATIVATNNFNVTNIATRISNGSAGAIGGATGATGLNSGI